MARPSVRERLAAKIVPGENDCLVWTGHLNTRGYGVISINHRTVMAHRAAYIAAHGEIPEGLQIDHLCGNIVCCNPAHMETVTGRTNIMRSNGPAAINARKTHCKNGHAFDSEHGVVEGTKRRCRTCMRARERAAYARRMATA